MLRRYNEILLNKTYDGSNGLKECVEIEEEKWMVKSHSRIKNTYDYSNSIYSEHIGSGLFRLLGIDSQETMLGIHKFRDDKERESVYCKDIEYQTGKQLVTFKKLFNTLGNSMTSARILLSDFNNIVKNQNMFNSDEVLKWFYKVYAIDTILSNPDRHLGNIAMLFDGSNYTIAPIYDCGSCLYPQMPEEIQKKIVDERDENEITKRVDEFMTSAFEEDFNGKVRKINYKEYIMRTGDKNILDGYKWLSSVYDREKVLNWIYNQDCVPSYVKKVSQLMIQIRYKRIVEAALDRWENSYSDFTCNDELDKVGK